MTDKKNDPVNLSGAYVLNALDADEARAFEAEIAISDQTRYEVTELRDTAVLLGLAVTPVTPSADLKVNLMAKLATTPQLPAIEPEHEISDEESVREFEMPSKAARKAQARWFARPVVVLTSMAAAVALILGGVVVSTNISDTNQQRAAVAQLAEISSASDAKNVTTDISTGGKATVMWSTSLASAAVTLNNASALPSDKTYELWFIGASGPRPAGLFTPDATGTAWRVLDGTMQHGDTIGVTVEPSGGSTTPTTTPVVAQQTV